MRIPTQLSYVFSGTATVALLAGCGPGSGSTPAGGSAFVPLQSVAGSNVATSSVRQLQPRIINPNTPTSDVFTEDAGKPNGTAIFVSDYDNNVVYVFNAAGTRTGTLTGFDEPEGMSSDKTAHIYIADTGNSRIQIYAKPYKTVTSLSDAGQYPVDVDVDSTGDVGVVNAETTSGGPASVSFYLKGKKKPKTLTSSSLKLAGAGAFDGKGNFFFEGYDAKYATAVFEVNSGAKGTAITELTTGNGLQTPIGVAVTTTGLIAVLDYKDGQETPVIYSYAAPTGNSLGSPVSTTSLTGSFLPGFFAFTKTNASLYTADAGLKAYLAYKYPAGGDAIQTIDLPPGSPDGIAVTPYEKP